MRAALNLLIIGGLLIAAFVHYGNRIPQLKQLSFFQSKDTDSAAEKEPAATTTSDKPVTIVSPLQQLMEGSDPKGSDSNPDKPAETQTPWKTHKADLIAPSPVGTSGVILHKTFSVATAAGFSFLIPAHAATPKLHGHYRGFTHQEGIQGGDESGDVAFVLMNEEQHADFASGHPADVLLSLEAAHDQEVNFGLPASRNQPARFYLVFRNLPGESKKTVQADFSVDF
jgi:hypothetical protein